MIRDATPADADVLATRLGGLPLLARYGMSAADLARRLRDAMTRGEGVLVACDDSGPVAFAWFLTGGTFGVGGYLRLIAVAPEHQSKQLGAALLDEVEARVRAAGARSLFLLVSDFNQAAQRFYAAHGYAHSGRLEKFVRDDVDELIFWKRL
jgi:ribosomal protein S18 acetylase RimI-like enzyme